MSDTDVEFRPVDSIVVAFPAGKTDFSGAIRCVCLPITWMELAAWM